jgi:glycosyltransferase involved in cell wall biosynthesis
MTARRLRIAIATLGRFHVLDLARELSRLGHEVHFYSYVPRTRAETFGLPRQVHVALLPLLFPLVGIERFAGTGRWRPLSDRALHWAANRAVRARLRPCDVFIAMSGIYLEASEYARRKYAAKIVVERGSRHILSQKQILDEIAQLNPDCQRVPGWIVDRELAHYEMADLIAVPSRHAEQSFIEAGVSGARLFRNPYGVDFSMFANDTESPRSPATLLFAGTWSYRKGADLLVEALTDLPHPFELVHVGPAGDAPFPRHPWFRSVGPIEQRSLRDWYSRATALILPSREEGLALVQAQALACGCPIIVSDRTGGDDLAEALDGLNLVDVFPAGDVVKLKALITARLKEGPAPVAADMVRSRLARAFQWSSYAARYSARLEGLVPPGGIAVSESLMAEHA